MDERAKKVADMDRSSRLNVVWDLAEEFKVKILTKYSYIGVNNFFHNKKKLLTPNYKSTIIFQFAMLIYDLGLAGSDVDMANSIWRRFFLGKEDPDVEKIELLVKYVRKTVASLDQIKIEDLYSMEPGSALSWPDIKKLEIERTSQ